MTLNLSPEARSYFEAGPESTIYQDHDGHVWEKVQDPWHPDAFKDCPQSIQLVIDLEVVKCV